MLRKVSVVTLVIVGLALTAAAMDRNAEEETEAIAKTALDYGEGWYEGNAERMEQALHPDLAKRALMPDPRSGKGRIDQMSALTLVQMTRAGYGSKTPQEARRTEVTILDIHGNAASVKLQMHDWVDYMHMTRIDGQWKIVNVLWEFNREAKEKYGMPHDL